MTDGRIAKQTEKPKAICLLNYFKVGGIKWSRETYYMIWLRKASILTLKNLHIFYHQLLHWDERSW